MANERGTQKSNFNPASGMMPGGESIGFFQFSGTQADSVEPPKGGLNDNLLDLAPIPEPSSASTPGGSFKPWGAGILSGATTFANAYVEATTTKAINDFNATQLELEALMGEFRAEDAIKRGEYASQKVGMAQRIQEGRRRASTAAQGIVGTSGSPMAVKASQEALSAIDRITIQNNAWRQAWGLKTSSTLAKMKAKLMREGGEEAYRRGLITGGLQAVSSGMGAYGGGK